MSSTAHFDVTVTTKKAMYFTALKEGVELICRAYEDGIISVEKVIHDIVPKKLRLNNRTR